MGPTKPLFRLGGSVRAEQEQPRQFYVGDSSRTQVLDEQIWDVHHFRKNSGEIFYGSTDPKEALDWLDTA